MTVYINLFLEVVLGVLALAVVLGFVRLLGTVAFARYIEERLKG
jgi:multisubunit Na+/H+ antiporter MnhF subunit